MGFSPKLLIKSTFRNTINNTRRNPTLPSTSNESTLSNLITTNINNIQTNHNSNNNLSYSYARLKSNASNSSDTLSFLKSTSDVLTIISKQKICVVRKYGAQEETLVKKNLIF